ncbi:nucleoside hydrolase, partial [Bacteroidota bacterium]
MKKFIIVFSIILLTINNLFADSGKARFHVIIDTDCAPDDLRAISLMLASSDFEILAITTSDGILKPKEGYIKIKSLLKEFGHEGIPVAYGEDINSEKSIYHSTWINIAWGKDQNIIPPQNSQASDLIINEINNEKEMVIVLCLGPLTNIIDIISIAEIKPQIDKVLWYCDDIENRKGPNFEIDTLSAKSFIESD